MAMEVVVAIVGAGPSCLATSACLNSLFIQNIVLEREDCYASLWKKRTYDCMKVHLGKQFCQLPYMSYPSNEPTFMPKEAFLHHLDEYTSSFRVCPRYLAKYLVIAIGENSEGFVPKKEGLDSFDGEILRSSKYENGERFSHKKVLVVGCGNSGMEIAYDLSNYDAKTSISVHILTKELVYFGMVTLRFLPVRIVDRIVSFFAKLKYGDLSSYGFRSPKGGPFLQKLTTGRSPTIDVGTVAKIKKGEIKVHPSINHTKGRGVTFANGKTQNFDAIIFATGYKSTVRHWLKGGDDLINQEGLPLNKFPKHWKGNKGLYCAGFAARGLFGIAQDAQNIANDISSAFTVNGKLLK